MHVLSKAPSCESHADFHYKEGPALLDFHANVSHIHQPLTEALENPIENKVGHLSLSLTGKGVLSQTTSHVGM